jgi:hypothetical protein
MVTLAGERSQSSQDQAMGYHLFGAIRGYPQRVHSDPGSDGKVRNVSLTYKQLKADEMGTLASTSCPC